jgi:hypothetical protein
VINPTVVAGIKGLFLLPHSYKENYPARTGKKGQCPCAALLEVRTKNPKCEVLLYENDPS